jgi:hypothetical protein
VAVWGVVGVIHVKIYRSHKGSTCPNQGWFYHIHH